jgi:hypothetical protein
LRGDYVLEAVLEPDTGPGHGAAADYSVLTAVAVPRERAATIAGQIRDRMAAVTELEANVASVHKTSIW